MKTIERVRWLSPRFFLWSFVFWTGFGLLQLAVPMLTGPVELGDAENWLPGFASMVVPYWLVTPPIFALAERFTRRRGRGFPYVARLAGLAIVGALFKSTVWLVLVLPLDLESAPALLTAMGLGEVMRCGAIVGTAAAVAQYRLTQERRQEALTAQLRALRSQLQPHFLFNTLQAIGSTARTDGPLAARLTALLGDLLRQSLRERDELDVRLADELELLAPYLELQRLRFGDRLTVDVDVPMDLLTARVPDLVLQPLVENALQHGIEQRPGAGRIVIAARRLGGELELSVRDDGAGDAAAGVEGTGLGTTRSRLAALYGARAALHVEPAAGGGTIATLRLPLEAGADAA